MRYNWKRGQEKNMDSKFDIKRRGYDKAQVDEYILNLTRNYERSLAAQRDRIESMKAEIAAKEKLLQEYISRKESITNSITQAVEKAKQIEYTAKVRYALEGERLAMFSSKWVRYCESMTNAVDKNLLQNAKNYVESAKKQIEEGLSADLNLGAYLGEAAEIYETEKGRLAAIKKRD